MPGAAVRLREPNPSKQFGSTVAALVAIILASQSPSTASAVTSDPPRFAVAAGASETTLFNWYTDRCTKTDTPDAPPRAFRDHSGQIHLLAVHQDNRAFIGPDFDHLSHPCTVIYEGDHSDDPQQFDDRQWLAAFATENGRDIFALVHDEFQANLRPALCPSRKYLSCWYNAITFAVSRDGGASFHQPAAPGSIVAAPSVPYAPDAGHPVGYFQPTNIVRKNNAYYVMFLATQVGSQSEGICVARTEHVDDPGSWRAWDGAGYNARLSGAYDSANVAANTCAPVGKQSLFELGSLSYDRASDQFVYLGAISIGSGDAAHPPGAYVSISRDLVTWSAPMLLFRSPDSPHGPASKLRYGLFALIDESSGRRDFSEISTSGRLFLYYVKFDLTNQPYARTLVKVPVQRLP